MPSSETRSMSERRSTTCRTPIERDRTLLTRKSTPSFTTTTLPQRTPKTSVNRNGNLRYSFNARLGANGPADTDEDDKNDWGLEDISAQLAVLSTKPAVPSTKPTVLSTKPTVLSTKSTVLSTKSTVLSTKPASLSTKPAGLGTNPLPEIFFKSFNDRLNKARSVDSQKSYSDVSSELDECVISNGSVLPQEDSVDQSLDEILSMYIKEEKFSPRIYCPPDLNKSFVSYESADLNDSCVHRTSGVAVSEKMSKRDYLGNEKTESNLLKNLHNRKCSVDEDVIKKDSEFNVKECDKAIHTATLTEAQGRFNSLHSEIYHPNWIESPPCSAAKISRNVVDNVIEEDSEFKVEECKKTTDLAKPKEAEERFKTLYHSDNYQPRPSELPQCSAAKISGNLAEDVIQEDSELKIEESFKVIHTTKPKEAQRKLYSRHNDVYQPRRSESPQCSAARISRNDYPPSFGTKGRRSSYYDADISEEVEKYFSKRFYLSREFAWELPEPSQLFSSGPWDVKELIDCKSKLNAVKEKLDELKLKDWHAHTKRRNKAGQVVWKLRKLVNPEFPTQAWCKFYENMCTFKLIPKKAERDRMLNSVHLCEAPGAFITSLNHYIKTNYDDDFQWNWLGTTLNPHYEGNPLSLMINEDRFILHTMKHWTFGEDQTGDLMNPPNLEDLRERAEEMGEVLLVTADGSIDCQDDPAEQENVVAWLHFCEAVSALSVLAKGGNFLLKIFTVFEHMTICLLFFLSCVFEEVIVNKPATSKEGNSETYVVCKNYVGRSNIEPWLSKILLNYGPNRPRKSLFPKDSIPKEFLEAVIECAEAFREYQSEVITANLESFNNPDERESSRNERIRRAVTDEFFVRYRLKELPEEFDIVGRSTINKMESYNMDPRFEVGSFSDRMKRKEVPERQKMLDLKEDIERLDRQVSGMWPADEKFLWYKFDSDFDHNLSNYINILTGKPVKRINSSKFCLGRLLDIRNQVREIILNSKACDLPSFSTTSEHLVERPSQLTVLDFKNALWSSSDAGLNAEEEFRAFRQIIKEFDKLARDDNLVIYGYPLLTQFNVGLVYLLAHSFQRVGITRPKGQNFAIFFEKHESSIKKFRVKEKLDEISENIQPSGKTVLAMLPIQVLCEGQFSKYVTMANNICVKEQVLELIELYLLASESKADREKRRRTVF